MISILQKHFQFFLRTKGRMIICLVLLSCPLFQVNAVFPKSNGIIIDDWPVKTENFGLVTSDNPRWDKTILFVYFANYHSLQVPVPPGSLADSRLKFYFYPNEAIWEAFKLWEAATEFNFFKTDSISKADIIIEWGYSHHYPNLLTQYKTKEAVDEFIANPPLAIANHFYEVESKKIVSAEIYFVDTFNWYVGNHFNEPSTLTKRQESVTSVALHEIGHVLGLPHSSVDDGETDPAKLDSIMYYKSPKGIYSNGFSKSISLQDIVDIHNLYGTDIEKVDIDRDTVDVTNDNCPCLNAWCDGLFFVSSSTSNGNQQDKNGNGVGDKCDGNSAPLTRVFLGLTTRPVATNINDGKVFQLSAFDPDNDTLTFSLETAAEHGEVVVTGSGQVRYTPQFDFEGKDTFQYRVEDPDGLFAIDEINIIVVRPKHSMVITKTGSGDGRVSSNPLSIDCGADCITDIASGDTVILKAEPVEGSIFLGWDGNCNSSGISDTCTVEMDSGQIIIARFEEAPASFNLSINKTGTGSGTITSNFSDIDCGTECTGNYANGANAFIILNATPDEGSVFRGWNGACSGTGNCTVTMYNDKDITATFATAMPTIFSVSNLNDNGTGSLRQAVIDANNNPGDDVIIFSTELSGTITLRNGQITITDSVVIDGTGADVLTISGNNTSRILEIDPGTIGTVTINGLSLKEGRDTSGNGGGGIIIDTGTVVINHVFLSNNSANEGGGGGGIRKFGPGALTISNSTLSGNMAIDEFDQGDGGGLRIDQGEGKLIVVNSTLSGNSSANGGGITIDDGLLILTNSTVTGNSAVNSGGGIFNGFSSELTLSNSLVAGNTAPIDKNVENFGTFLSLGHNLFGENGKAGVTADTTLASTDLIPTGALNTVIGSLTDNGGPTPTHMPVEKGQAVDAGNITLISGGTINDQRGADFYRVNNSSVDIGSVESIVSNDPRAVTLSSPSGIIQNSPVFTWKEDSNATWYRLFVGDSSEKKVHAQWYDALNICSGGNCSVTLQTELSSGSYGWFVKSWNDFGSVWSEGMSFIVQGNDSPPTKVTHMSPLGATQDSTPTFTWAADPDSSWYRLWIGDPNEERVFGQWYDAADICSNGNCSITLGTELMDGTYEWYVKSWNDFGKVWSDGMGFTVNE